MAEKIVMTCPNCGNMIKGDEYVGISQIHSVVHFSCGSLPLPGEKVIEIGSFEDIIGKYLV
ncbi:hypothetical protein AWH48_11680 [Domibacillus aminovorans]|uniref:Uncharacterized protein n=1 Tax=Domibacillus aminovorans TaxID=29332 RepID=A0A177KMX5_9BACI|nr:hypothetical protein [Domibacillus aminovorans]OAH53921.1 hypothetical protein AWH48_11680 [Domibacillus aminovorans]